ncbi:MAG: PBP1A family penicillin-binding protein [Acidobacteriota bacterium]
MAKFNARKLIPSRRVLKYVLIVLAFAVVVSVGSLGGFFLAYQRGLPRVQAIEDYRPSLITEIITEDGVVTGQFALERRILIRYEDMPPVLRNALLAAEDPRYFTHWGIDPIGITRAFIKNLIAGRVVEGASTITQQLAQMLFVGRQPTYRRKIEEAMLSLQIEKNYTKEQIFTLYANQIYLGHGVYGVEAASEFYFNKHAKEVTLPESAMIAGLVASPGRFSPITNPGEALQRRNHILSRMRDEKMISAEECTAAQATPISISKPPRETSASAYFNEEIRKFLEERFGSQRLYHEGLIVQSTLNEEMQKAAVVALRKGLRDLDKRQGFRKITENWLKQGGQLETFHDADWDQPFREGDIVRGLVTDVSDKAAHIKLGTYTATLDPSGIKWTYRTAIRQVLTAGDVAPFLIHQKDESTLTCKVSLEQVPRVEGALVALEPATGEVRAMVGGYDYNQSKFNRATQALRQVGSAFKPFIYCAAIDSGLPPPMLLLDAPVTFFDKWTGTPWTPHNYDQKYKGMVTMRRALEQSRNVPTARLLDKIGVDKAVELAKRFGITSKLHPFLSLSLGTSEVTLLEMTSAFSAFPNQGVRVEPRYIRMIKDRQGSILYETHLEAHEVVRAETAFVTLNLMRGVVDRGTATRAKVLKRPLGGKTGTTDDYSDAWFIGYTPSLCVGVWVGFDTKKTLGKNEVGARAALPIWVDFMGHVMKDKPIEQFAVPPGVAFAKVDRLSGFLATPMCTDTILECFIKGTEPNRFCADEDHRLTVTAPDTEDEETE